MGNGQAVSSDAVFDQLARVRASLVERMWRSFFLLSLLLLPILLWRTWGVLMVPQSGAMSTNLVFIAIASAILAAFPMRHRIPFAIRAAIPVAILSLVGLVSLIVFGAASVAFGWLVQSNFLLSTLYSLRAGIIATVVTAGAATVVGVLFLSGVLVNHVDLHAYFLLPTTWIMFVLGTTVVPTVILYSIGGYQKTIGELLTNVQAKRDKLAEMSDQLGHALRAEERANATKSEFLAHMTHELRTPLSGVIGMLEIAEKRTQDPQMAHLIEVAHHNAESLLRIINDVLDFSKIEAGKVTLDPEYFDLNDFISSSMEVFHLRADEKNIIFRHHVDPQLASVRYGDPVRLRQVLFNLVSNAMKFTEVGRVDLEVRPAFREQPGDPHVLFVVRDTGVGIAEQALGKLFRDFEQADASVQKRYGGTGLGLAISKMLIEAMEGRIEVHSREGHGSTFEVVLPLPACPSERLAEVRRQTANAPMLPHDYQLNVLLAEDTLTNQVVMRNMLEEMGHRVSLVETGRAAVLAAARENFDLILMDLRMPELGGVEATTLIRHGGTADACVVDRDIFICAMTANATAQEQDKTVRVGMNAFLTKPVRQIELHALLTRAIEFQQARGVPLVDAIHASPVDRSEFEHLLDLVTDHATPDTTAAAAPDHRAHNPPHLAATLRNVFSRDASSHLIRLRRHAAELNWSQVRELAHAVCGAAAAADLQTIRSVAAELESACLQQATAPCAALAERLASELEQFLKEEA
ncbi:MAG: response regulator [Rhodoferax sp.]|nr:response regulator [Rhodoferax sp.]